jgi:hypothetical protein
MNVDFEKEAEKSMDALIYEAIGAQGIHYYNIFGLKIYATCAHEVQKRDYAQKIADFIFSLQSEDFKVHRIQYEKPKIHDGSYFSCWSNEITEDM